MRTFMKIAGLVFIIFVINATASAQTIDTAWTQIYWNGFFDSVNCIQETSDHGFIMIGVTKAEGEAQDDINLIKTDSVGNVDWAKIMNPGTYDCGYHVLETSDGGYLLSTQTDAFGTGPGDFKIWIVKTDSDGDTVWSYPIMDPDGNGFPLHAIQTGDSGYAVTGAINVDHDNHAFILRLNKDGGSPWCRLYGAESHQDGWFITEMDDNGFMIAGNTNDPYSTLYDFWVLRTDQSGNLLWDSTYALTDGYDMLYGACRVDDGLVMTGVSNAAGHALKVDFDGNTIWSKSISKNFANERNTSICPTYDSGLLVGGWVWVTGQRRDYSFIKLNADGDTLWSYTVGGSQDDNGRCLIPTWDGAYAQVGTSSSFVNGSSFYLVKMSDVVSGDTNGDGVVNIGDPVFLLNYIFRFGPPPEPLCKADANGDDSVNVGDAVYLLNYIFSGGPPPIVPCCP